MGENQKPANPLLAGFKKIPGLSIRLPSKALLYDSTQLQDSALKTGEVHIHPMSAKDELVLKSPDLLLSGEGIRQIIKRCVPEVVETLELFQPDVDAILIGLRIATYGDSLDLKVENPYYDPALKGSLAEINYKVPLKPLLAQSTFIEEIESFIVNLENGQVVIIRPIKYKDSLSVIQEEIENASKKTETREDNSELINDQLRLFERTLLSMIDEVDGVKDKEQIKEWFDLLPVKMFKQINTKIEELSKLGPNLITTVKDPITQKTWDIVVPANPIDFFDFGPSKVTLTGFFGSPIN